MADGNGNGVTRWRLEENERDIADLRRDVDQLKALSTENRQRLIAQESAQAKTDSKIDRLIWAIIGGSFTVAGSLVVAAILSRGAV